MQRPLRPSSPPPPAPSRRDPPSERRTACCCTRTAPRGPPSQTRRSRSSAARPRGCWFPRATLCPSKPTARKPRPAPLFPVRFPLRPRVPPGRRACLSRLPRAAGVGLLERLVPGRPGRADRGQRADSLLSLTLGALAVATCAQCEARPSVERRGAPRNLLFLFALPPPRCAAAPPRGRSTAHAAHRRLEIAYARPR